MTDAFAPSGRKPRRRAKPGVRSLPICGAASFNERSRAKEENRCRGRGAPARLHRGQGRRSRDQCAAFDAAVWVGLGFSAALGNLQPAVACPAPLLDPALQPGDPFLVDAPQLIPCRVQALFAPMAAPVFAAEALLL